MNRTISIDWLSLYCECYVLNDNNFYKFERQNESSGQFKEIWKVYDKIDKELYCVIQRTPWSPIIPKHTTMVKVANRYLYRQDWNTKLMHFLNVCHIIPKSISRIDIAADFNHFDNNLKVESFIQGFLSNKYIKMGQNKYTLMGEQKNQHEYSYLRFGNRESEISAYLYNKSKELKEVHDKPYIREMWEENGINTKKDVWRLEVSLRNKQMKTIVKQTGEMLRIDLDFLKTQGIVENVFNCAVLKAFDFRINDNQKQKRRMKRLELFRGMTSTLLMVVPTNEACTNRMDKIVVKKLANCVSEYRVDNQESYEIIRRAMDEIITQCGLKDYYYEKVHPQIKFFKDS